MGALVTTGAFVSVVTAVTEMSMETVGDISAARVVVGALEAINRGIVAMDEGTAPGRLTGAAGDGVAGH
jgi:hypothetical protein